MKDTAARPSGRIGLWSLTQREILRYWVVAHQTLLPPMVSSFLFFLIFGVSLGGHWHPAGYGGSTYLDYLSPGLVALYLISSSFENTSSSLFIGRWHNHIQEILLSPLSYGEMVMGFIAGGLSRGLLTGYLVLGMSLLFGAHPVEHPLLLFVFLTAIGITFSCAGLLAALWADDFGMLSIWNIYVITPLVYLGGVFSPLNELPAWIGRLGVWNPMFHLVSGVRYSILGQSDGSLTASLAVAFFLMLASFAFTVTLFRKGYKLRV